MPTTDFNETFISVTRLKIRQRFEAIELMGIEGRNKYEISGDQSQSVGFASEQQKGFLGFLFRQFLGHWRSFEIHLYDSSGTLQMIASHPFRFFFQRLELSDENSHRMGALQQRFAIFSKKFDIVDDQGQLLMIVKSPIWRIWTFPVFKAGREVATIVKKWSGFLVEGFTDKDVFGIEFRSQDLSPKEKQILLAATIFVDLQYFEKKGNR